MTDLRSKRTFACINGLKNIGETTNASVKFITDTTPFDDRPEDSPLPTSEEWTITGKILPISNYL